jgi:hypothetical protein
VPTDNFANEEYWGLFNADRTPKVAVAALAKTWSVPTTDADRAQIIKVGTEFKAATLAVQAAQAQVDGLQKEKAGIEADLRGVDARISNTTLTITETQTNLTTLKPVVTQAQADNDAALAAIQDWQNKNKTALENAYKEHSQGILDGTRYYESEVGKGLGLNKETAGLGVFALLSSLLLAFGWRNKKHTLKVVVLSVWLWLSAPAQSSTQAMD